MKNIYKGYLYYNQSASSDQAKELMVYLEVIKLPRLKLGSMRISDVSWT